VRKLKDIDTIQLTSDTDSEDQKDQFRKNDGNHNQYCRDLEGELNKRFLLVCEPAVAALAFYPLTIRVDAPS
jgi:hypothetical protein